MKLSLRVWQTLLFITVIVVAMLTLSYSLMSSTQQSVARATRHEVSGELRYLVGRIAFHVPLDTDTRAAATELRRFSEAFKSDARLFDKEGRQRLAFGRSTRPSEPLIREAVTSALRRRPFFSPVPDREGEVVAARAVIGEKGAVEAAVLVGNNGADSRRILEGAGRQITIAFWVALVVSGLLGIAFSEVIARQVRRVSEGALAIAQGNFDLRLKTMFPHEVGELATSFNLMAERLGSAFAALSEQQREISTVVETMAEGLIAVDDAFRIRLINPAAAELLQQPIASLEGRRIQDAIGAPGLVQPIEGALAGRQVSDTYEYGESALLLHASPIRGGAGRPVGVVLILRDVTQQKRMEQAQRDFISHASHELRTPISSLRGFIELLEGGAKDEAGVRERFLTTMETEVDRLQRLIEDLFTLAQLDSGRLDLKLSANGVAGMVNDIIELVRPIATSSDVVLETEIEASLPKVMCDRDRMLQVLLGFVDNALKHSEAGGKVLVFAMANADLVRMGVTDTGPGVPRDEMARIFERFYRVPSGSGADKKGAGLGLSIAKEIVDAHGSKIGVESKPGESTTFFFDLAVA